MTLTDEEIADIYRDAFNSWPDRKRAAPPVPSMVIAFARAVETTLMAHLAQQPTSELPELPDAVAHVHSNGEVCMDRPVSSNGVWPVELVTLKQAHDYALAHARALAAAPSQAADHSVDPDEMIARVIRLASEWVTEELAMRPSHARAACRAFEHAVRGLAAVTPAVPEKWREFIQHWTHEGHLQTFEDRERFRKAARDLLAASGTAPTNGGQQ